MENAAEQAQQAQGWTAWRPSIWVRARYWTINMQTFEAGSAVLGQKEGKKENCLIIHPEGTSLPRRPKRIIVLICQNVTMENAAEQAQQAQGWTLSEGRPFSASTLLNDKHHANLRSTLCSAWTKRGQER